MMTRLFLIFFVFLFAVTLSYGGGNLVVPVEETRDINNRPNDTYDNVTVANLASLYWSKINNAHDPQNNVITGRLTNNGFVTMHNSSSGVLKNSIGAITNNRDLYMHNTGTGKIETTINGNIDNSGIIKMFAGPGIVNNTIIGDITNTKADLEDPAINMSNSTNIITGNITNNNGTLSMYNSNNTVTGNITNNKNISMRNSSSSNHTNTITGNIINNGSGNFEMHNEGSASLANIINGNITNSYFISMFNSGTGSLTNTINGTLTLENASGLTLGGPRSTTTINTLTWNGGDMYIYSGDSSFGFGSIHMQTMNFPAVETTIRIAGTGIPVGDSATYTLFYYDNFTGDPTKVKFHNGVALSEITYADGTVNGFQAQGAGALCRVTVTRAVLSNNAANTDTSTVAMANNVVQHISNPARGGMTDFRFTPAVQNAFYALQRQHRHDREKSNAFKDMLQVVAEANQGIPFIKQVANYKIWMTPYYSHTHNDFFWQKGFSENLYGLIMGGAKSFKEKEITLGVTVGGGISKMKMKARRENQTDGKQFLLGGSFQKTINKKLEFIVNLTGLTSYYESQRLGQPIPGQSYLAKSKYHTLTGNTLVEMGYILRLPNKLSIRPEIGIDSTMNKRYGYSERDAGIYAQAYKRKTTPESELYTGLSIRKTITGEKYEVKFTCAYELGVLTNHHKKTDLVYVANAPSGVRFTLPSAGDVTHYVNTYFSALNIEKNFKMYGGILSTIKRHQKSFTFSIKAEYRF